MQVLVGGDVFREVGHFGMDVITNDKVLGKFILKGAVRAVPIVGWVYTAADFGVSFFEYTPVGSTEQKDGWTALGHWILDSGKKANQTKFEMTKKYPMMTGRRW